MQLFSNRDTASVVALAPNIGLAGALARGAPSFGGADRDRTGDPLLAKQVLSQLSYSPLNAVVSCQLSVVSTSDN